MADGQVVPENIAVLSAYAGERPNAPSWFTKAVKTPYETRWIEVAGAKIHYQRWGNSDKPGLLLVHGNGAHAHWYDFIAPFLSDDYCIVALTFGGMGDSDWRQTYDLETFSAEQVAVCEDAGLFAGGRKPIIVAHSFGGFITMATGGTHGDLFAGVIIVDSPVRSLDDPHNGPPDRQRPNRIYADFNAALGRFRLAPAQPCENHFIVDFIGRHSLKEISTPEGQAGWTWKFDPSIWRRFHATLDPRSLFENISCRLSVMRGEQSVLVNDKSWAYMRTLRDEVPMVSIADARHHVMLDQPQAFVKALRAQLSAWDY